MDTARDPHADSSSPSLSLAPDALNARLRAAGPPPLLLDVRREAAFAASGRQLAGATRCAPEAVAEFAANLAPAEVVVYCRYGHELGREAAETLRAAGWDARYLEGGIEGGEDGVDAPDDIARWRASPPPMATKSRRGSMS